MKAKSENNLFADIHKVTPKNMIVSADIVPKYYRIASHLREQIISNKLANGNKLAGERELASKFGTTHITIRKALDCLVQEGLVERIHGKGSFVRSVDEGNTIAIAFDVQVFDGAVSPYFSSFARKSLSYWRNKKFKCELCFVCYENPQSIKRFEQQLRSRIYRGVVVVSQPVADKLVKLANHLNIPMVGPYPYKNVPYYVGFDGQALIKSAVKILTAKGIKKIGLLVGKDNFGNYRKYIKLFKSTLREYDGTSRSDWIITGDYNAEFGSEALNDIWRNRNRPQALIITDEVIAGGTIKSASDLKINLGEDLYIVSQFSEDTNIPTPDTVIKLIYPVEKQIELIGKLLTNLMAGKRVLRNHILMKPLIGTKKLSKEKPIEMASI